MSRSPTITHDEPISTDPADWLPNPHAGEMVQTEFLDPLEMDAAVLADSIGVPARRVIDFIEGRVRIDAELDLRLARYFRMSDGFFMGLQDDYELLEQRRALGAALNAIIPRAA